MKRIAALLFTILGITGIGIATATPAAAACGPLKNTALIYVAPDNYRATANVGFVDCGTYKRGQWVTFTNTGNYLTVSDNYGRPSLYLRSYSTTGPVVDGFDGLTTIFNGYNAALAGAQCREPCVAEFDAYFNKPGNDYVFHFFKTLI